MICKHCGAEIPDGSRFCTKCGQKVEAQEPTPVNAPAGFPPVTPGNAQGGFPPTPPGNAQSGFPPVNPGNSQGGFPPVNPGNAQGGFPPVNPGNAQGGFPPVNRPVTPPNAPGAGAAQTPGPKKPLSKNSIIGICAVAAVIILVVVIIAAVAGGKPTIDLNDYVTVEFSGYNGYGRATARIDWDGIDEKYGKKLSFTDKAKEELQGFADIISPVEVIQQYIRLSLEPSSELKNGDDVTYEWEVDEELTEYVKCKVKYSESKREVDGLEKVSTFDPFADLEVTFSGISPNGYVNINYTGSTLSSYAFTCADSTSGLKNGDTVTVTLNNTDADYYVNNYGMVPSSTSQSYTVEGLDEYVGSYADLRADFIDNLKSESEDTIVAYAANSYNQTSSLSQLIYEGYIFGAAKDSSSRPNNYLYIIMSGTVSSSTSSFKPGKVYFPVRYENLLHGSEGYSFDSYGSIAGSSSLDGGYYTNGYRNPLSCHIDLVEANRDSYTIESGDGFEVYADYDLISKLSDISDTYKDTLSAEATDTIESYIASNYNSERFTVSDLKLAGEYLLLAKNQGTDFANNNKYFLVFSATVTSTEDLFEAVTVYYPLEYDGVVKLPKDEYMVTNTQRSILGSFSFPNTWYSSRGYIDGATMYSEIITRNRNSFTYEVSTELQAFGN